MLTDDDDEILRLKKRIEANETKAMAAGIVGMVGIFAPATGLILPKLIGASVITLGLPGIVAVTAGCLALAAAAYLYSYACSRENIQLESSIKKLERPAPAPGLSPSLAAAMEPDIAPAAAPEKIWAAAQNIAPRADAPFAERLGTSDALAPTR